MFRIFNCVRDKTEKIKRNTLIDDITKGGLDIVDVAWIPSLLQSMGFMRNIIDS